MKNLSKIIFVVPMLLASCKQYTHPIIGNTFDLDNTAPVASYQEGYDEKSYLQLLSSVSSFISFSSVNDITSRFKDEICEEGFLKVSTVSMYDDLYMCFGTKDEKTVKCFLTDKVDGASEEKFYFAKYSLEEQKTTLCNIVSASSAVGLTGKKFEIYAFSFEKDNDKYKATVVSKYYPDRNSSEAYYASFIYSFTKR